MVTREFKTFFLYFLQALLLVASEFVFATNKSPDLRGQLFKYNTVILKYIYNNQIYLVWSKACVI